jgi:hypothetical protein
MSKRQICDRDDCGPENPYCKAFHPTRPCRRGPECQKPDCTFSHKEQKQSGDPLKREIIRNGNDIYKLAKQLVAIEDKLDFIIKHLPND